MCIDQEVAVFEILLPKRTSEWIEDRGANPAVSHRPAIKDKVLMCYVDDRVCFAGE